MLQRLSKLLRKLRSELTTIGIGLADLARPATRLFRPVAAATGRVVRSASVRLRYLTVFIGEKLRTSWEWVKELGGARWATIGAITASLLAVVILSATWLLNDTWEDTVSSTDQVAGTCHLVETVAEHDAFSDVRSPVPCDQPHHAETAFVGELTGDLADSQVRMTPEKRMKVINDLCAAPVRKYLGAGQRDAMYSIAVVLRLPTEGEWADGLRQYRCDVMPREAGNLVENGTISESMRNILRREAGAAFRRCWVDFATEVPCTKPHRSESVNATAPVPEKKGIRRAEWYTPADVEYFRKWADPICRAPVSEFLGRPVRHTPYLPEAHLTPDGRVIECSVASPDDRPLPRTSLAQVTAEEGK